MSDSGFEWLSWTLYDGVGTKKKKVTTTKYILRTIPIKGVNDQARNQISSSSGALRSYDQVCMTRIMRYRHIVSIRVHSMHRVPWMGDNYRWGRKDDDNNENTLKKHRIISSWRVQSIGLIRGRPFGRELLRSIVITGCECWVLCCLCVYCTGAGAQVFFSFSALPWIWHY